MCHSALKHSGKIKLVNSINYFSSVKVEPNGQFQKFIYMGGGEGFLVFVDKIWVSPPHNILATLYELYDLDLIKDFKQHYWGDGDFFFFLPVKSGCPPLRIGNIWLLPNLTFFLNPFYILWPFLSYSS